jgi:hypothetical protein
MIILMQICHSEHMGIRAGIPSVLDIAAMPMRAGRHTACGYPTI